ncbi:SLOG family protein [Ferrovum sp.]|uniref:A1S_2505 family phage non-structural protein n=1 Tax=Ferrovum sp. TaxID=2609467 RepID=UPI00260D9AF4|nr:SLOG family protein [Ferrovum sp.]
MMSFIFVFGSNRQGIHGAGAALFAKQRKGAVTGCGEGLQGQCYAIPTKITPYQTDSLDNVALAIERFKEFARRNPELRFQVTRIGCGLAGFDDADIEPMFADAPSNCYLPGVWYKRRGMDLNRVIIAGSRTLEGMPYSDFAATVSGFIGTLSGGVEIVSGTARGPDSMGERYAEENRIKLVRFPAQWNLYKNAAGMIRNQMMSWYGTHLLAFHDGVSPGTKGMIKMAENDGLEVAVKICETPEKPQEQSHDKLRRTDNQ